MSILWLQRESATDGNKLDSYFMSWLEARNLEIILNGNLTTSLYRIEY